MSHRQRCGEDQSFTFTEQTGVCVSVNISVSELDTTPYVPLLDVACITAMVGLCIHSNSCQMSKETVVKAMMLTASHSLLPPSGLAGHYKNKGEILQKYIMSNTGGTVCSIPYKHHPQCNVRLKMHECTTLLNRQRWTQ